jgi:hypothetical protein
MCTGTASNGLIANWRHLSDGRVEIHLGGPGEPSQFIDIVRLSADGRFQTRWGRPDEPDQLIDTFTITAGGAGSLKRISTESRGAPSAASSRDLQRLTKIRPRTCKYLRCRPRFGDDIQRRAGGRYAVVVAA